MPLGNTRWILGWMGILVLALASASRAATPTPLPPPKPLRIAVGGDYPDGLDGLLASRGLPHERLFSWEMADPAVLKRYEVLLLSCPAATRGALDPALMEWVAAGGRAYVEVWQGLLGPWPLGELVGNAGSTPQGADVLPAVGEHPITQGLSPKAVDTFHLQGTFLQPRHPDQTKVLARYCPDGGGTAYPSGVAVVCLAVGRGEIVYSGAPLSFCLFHRGPTTEPLVLRIIDYLAQGRAVPRLTSTAPAVAASASPRAVKAAPTAAEEGKAPSGLRVVEPAANPAYNVTAQVQGSAKEPARASVLLLDGHLGRDGQALQPALWLLLGRERVELRAGKSSAAPVLKSVRWRPPAGPAELLVRRRSGGISVVLGEKELLGAKTTVAPGGMVAAGGGGVALAGISYQPVEAPSFADDFMREATEADAWTPVSGKWRVVGVGNEEQSVNGFYLQGESAETALTTTGYRWWDDYAAGVSVRVEGQAAAGICALRQANGDCLAFEADSDLKPSAGLRLVQVRGGSPTVLARRAGGISPGQWYRLAIRLREGKVEALLDGEPVLQGPQREPRGGAMALLVRGGSARFDDVLVQPSSQPLAAPRDEGSPAAEMPLSLGPQDHLTWANPAAPWLASPERPSLLWHTGDFSQSLEYSVRLSAPDAPALRRLILAPSPTSPEREWLTVTATALPEAKEVALEIRQPDRAPVQKRCRFASGDRLSLEKRDGSVTVRWNGGAVLSAKGAGGLHCAGLEVLGPPVAAQDVQVRAPEVRDYVFGVAPTEWYASAGTWEVAARWACDPRWSWFAGWGAGPFAVWNKHRVDGDVAVDYYVGIKMVAPGGKETERCRDLNATLCGDRTNPLSGYSFILGGDGGVKTQLLRKGVVVAECPDVRVPSGYGDHHQWFRVRVAKAGRRVEMDFEGRPVFRWDDPNPLPGGFVGLWSRDSGILVPRVTVYR